MTGRCRDKTYPIPVSCRCKQERTRKERKKAGLEAKVGGRMQTRKRQRLNEEKGVTAILKFKIPAGNLRISLGKTFMNEVILLRV